jgi:biopolymer transport protein ExbD
MTIRRKTEPGPEPNLPVTPMLDMAFQLLAFFVMTYHPSSFEGQMELSLPSEAITQAKTQADVDQQAKSDKDQELQLTADVTVIVRTQRDNVNNGLISDISLQEESGMRPVGNSLDNLLTELKSRNATVANKDNIKIQADNKLKWEEVVNVMDVCQQAGFKNISFVKPPPG